MALIYVVEDDRSIQEIETFALSGAGFQTRGYDCAADFYLGLEEEKPDLVLLDIMLPDEDGLAVVRKLRSRRELALLPIILVTARTAEIDKVKGLDIGADDYLTKPFNPLELVARVKSQLRRYTQLGTMAEKRSNAYQTGGLFIDDDKKIVTVDDDSIKLTPIEYNILLFLLKNKGKVFSIEQIYENIWNEDAVGVDNTVAVHIRHIREKIEINPKEPRYLKVVWGVGYKVDKQ